MASCIWTFTVATTTLMMFIVLVSSNLQGPNVCSRVETYVITVNVSELVSYTLREKNWCFSMPPRCSTNRMLFKTVIKPQMLTKQRLIDECCEGFHNTTESGDRCVPIWLLENCHRVLFVITCVIYDECKFETGYEEWWIHINFFSPGNEVPESAISTVWCVDSWGFSCSWISLKLTVILSKIIFPQTISFEVLDINF